MSAVIGSVSVAYRMQRSIYSTTQTVTLDIENKKEQVKNASRTEKMEKIDTNSDSEWTG